MKRKIAAWVGMAVLWTVAQYFKGKLIERRVRVNREYAPNGVARITGYMWDRQGSEVPSGIKLKIAFSDATKVVPLGRVMRDYGLRRWYYQEG